MATLVARAVDFRLTRVLDDPALQCFRAGAGHAQQGCMRADIEELWCERQAGGGQVQLHIHRDGHEVSARLHLDGALRWTERFDSDEQAERRGWALLRLLRSGDLEQAVLAPRLVGATTE